MKLVINIPCFNEEKTLPLVLKEIPKKIPGIDVIEVQIVDDGSTDKTVEVARKLGVTRVIRHKHNLGLGTAFKHGVEAALEAGCDIFVNTDADNRTSRFAGHSGKNPCNLRHDFFHSIPIHSYFSADGLTGASCRLSRM